MINETPVWFAISVTVPGAASEAVEFAFNELDSLGTEINNLRKMQDEPVTVAGYFQHCPDAATVKSALQNALRIYNLPVNSILDVQSAEIENADWLAEWKKHWKPSRIGRFIIAAPWHEVDAAGKIVIRIEPNLAFGTGTHETTQLCLKAIEENYRLGQSFLDVGTGTGILAIAAAKSFPSVAGNIFACDPDTNSVAIARENAEVNAVGSLIKFSTGSLDEKIDNFDFVCANLTADVILPLLPLLIRTTREILVLSGILAEQEEAIINALSYKQPERSFHVEHLGEWISVTVRMR